jgi:hypothetical protein
MIVTSSDYSGGVGDGGVATSVEVAEAVAYSSFSAFRMLNVSRLPSISQWGSQNEEMAML